MSTITFIPQIAKIKLQGIPKSRKQKLTNLINEALKEYLEKEDLKIVQKQTKATIAYQGRMNKLFEKIKIPQDLRTKDVDELLTEEIVKKKLTYGNCLFRYKYSIRKSYK